MSNTGSLIQLHFHDNLELLSKLSDVSGILYYQGAPVFPSVSRRIDNALTTVADGLFISNRTMLSTIQYDIVSRFRYENGVLYFNNIVVSQEYTQSQIQDMVESVWQEIEPEFDISDYVTENESGGDTGDPTES